MKTKGVCKSGVYVRIHDYDRGWRRFVVSRYTSLSNDPAAWPLMQRANAEAKVPAHGKALNPTPHKNPASLGRRWVPTILGNSVRGLGTFEMPDSLNNNPTP